VLKLLLFEVRQSGGSSWQFHKKKTQTVAQLNGEKIFKRPSGASIRNFSHHCYKTSHYQLRDRKRSGVLRKDYTVQKTLRKTLLLSVAGPENFAGSSADLYNL